MAGAIDFYQIYYKEEQKSTLYPFAIPYFNETLTPFFENSIISKLVKATKAEKIGICSHSLGRKVRSNVPNTPRSRKLEEEDLWGVYDVLSLTVNSRKHGMLMSAEGWHPGFNEILQKIGRAIGQFIPTEVRRPIYQNHFIAKTEIYQQYIEEFLDPAMQAMTEDVELMGLCWQDSRYSRTILNEPVDFQRIEKLLGVNYYPMHPFLCERFFSCWLEGKDYINVQYL